jgi:hypothetical protein
VVERDIEVYVPEDNDGKFALWVHFHGASFIARHALQCATRPRALACVNMGVGSAAYEVPFAQEGVFARLLAAVKESSGSWHGLYLSGFSAGYGALRAILSDAVLAEAVDGVLAENELAPFLHFAQRAVRGEKKMLLTHSEVFPGTFASTTETADYLVEKMDLSRRAVLEWGPLGMQQLSDVQEGGLRLMGFAGNSAPDHMDHLHALFHFDEIVLGL